MTQLGSRRRADWDTRLPEGFYVRELADRHEPELPEGHNKHPISRKWIITGRNPDFWWDIIISRTDAEAGGFELHCTRCGLSDQAAAADDLIRLIEAGAHLHGIRPGAVRQ